MSDDKHDCKGKDEIFVGPRVGEDGTHAVLRHLPDHQVAAGFVRPVRDGQPLNGTELVSLHHIEDNHYEVTSLYGGQAAPPPTNDEPHGPARVNSPAFRDGWDRIFGKPQEVGQA